MSNLIKRAQASLEILRIKRARLFTAFDIYKGNVKYGIIQESQERHDLIVRWYQKCLNLDAIAIENPPEEIVNYLK